MITAQMVLRVGNYDEYQLTLNNLFTACPQCPQVCPQCPPAPPCNQCPSPCAPCNTEPCANCPSPCQRCPDYNCPDCKLTCNCANSTIPGLITLPDPPCICDPRGTVVQYGSDCHCKVRCCIRWT
jgi:hypothetical protein